MSTLPCVGFAWLLASCLSNDRPRRATSSLARSAPHDSRLVEDERPILEELFLLENPIPQDRGELQVTGAASSLHGDARRRQAGATVEYGLSDRFQLEASVPVVAMEDEGGQENGLGDIEVGVLWNAWRDARSVLSTAVDVTLPTGDEDADLGEGEAGLEPSLLYLLLVRDFGVFLNAGGEFGGGAPGLTYGTGLARTLDAWTLTTELAGSHRDSEGELVFGMGALWHGLEGMEVGIGVPIGLSEEADDWGWIITLTWESQVLDETE